MLYVLKMNVTLRMRILLLHVYEPPGTFEQVKYGIQQETDLYDKLHRDLKHHRDLILKDPEFKNYKIDVSLQRGEAASKIVHEAVEHKAKMVVMAASSLSRVERLIVGSNATQVIKKAPCTVMIIPPGAAYSPLKKIVYATDLLADNLKGLNHLQKFASKFKAAIQLVNVSTGGSEKSAEDKKATRSSIGSKNKVQTIYSESVSKGLSNFMTRNKADCMAVFHRTRSFFGEMSEKSVSNRLAFSCAIPALILHAHDRSF